MSEGMTSLARAFILHFGEMGRAWGINRTVGQIYALLYLSERPLPADEIADRLGFSRSNVSMGLKELESWRLTRMRHLPGDRREHFSVPEDVWEIVRTLAEERRRREVDPTLTVLRALLLEEPATDADRHAQTRLRAMHDLIETLVGWSEDMRRLPTARVEQLLRMGSRVVRVLEAKDRLLGPRAANDPQ